MSRVWKCFIAIALTAVIAGLVLAVQFNRFLHSPVAVGANGQVFEIPPGSAFQQVSEDLERHGIIDQPFYLQWYARLTDRAASIQAGEYQIESGSTPAQLLEMFVSGDVQLHSFTIVEGWNYLELLDALANDPIIETTLNVEDWSALLEKIGAEADHPEGLFLPETYRIPKGTSDTELLRQAFELMQVTLAEEWEARAIGLPIDERYEALILASIIEKETALASERPRISGVFVRRLEKRMRLQTDPTVIYGIGADFNGNLTRQDLRTDTPYNTYTRGGLPPTPIALPGKAAINAALHPAAGTELYFVATGLGDGSHHFSTTKDEHDAAVREYLARQRAARAQ